MTAKRAVKNGIVTHLGVLNVNMIVFSSYVRVANCDCTRSECDGAQCSSSLQHFSDDALKISKCPNGRKKPDFSAHQQKRALVHTAPSWKRAGRGDQSPSPKGKIPGRRFPARIRGVSGAATGAKDGGEPERPKGPSRNRSHVTHSASPCGIFSVRLCLRWRLRKWDMTSHSDDQ